MNLKKSGGLLLVITLLLLPTVYAQSNLLNFYYNYYGWVDFFVSFLFFTALFRLLGEKHFGKNQAVKLFYFSVGLAMSIALVTWEISRGYALFDLGPAVLIILIIAGLAWVFSNLKKKKGEDSSKCSLILPLTLLILGLLAIRIFFPEYLYVFYYFERAYYGILGILVLIWIYLTYSCLLSGKIFSSGKTSGGGSNDGDSSNNFIHPTNKKPKIPKEPKPKKLGRSGIKITPLRSVYNYGDIIDLIGYCENEEDDCDFVWKSDTYVAPTSVIKEFRLDTSKYSMKKLSEKKVVKMQVISRKGRGKSTIATFKFTLTSGTQGSRSPVKSIRIVEPKSLGWFRGRIRKYVKVLLNKPIYFKAQVVGREPTDNFIWARRTGRGRKISDFTFNWHHGQDNFEDIFNNEGIHTVCAALVNSSGKFLAHDILELKVERPKEKISISIDVLNKSLLKGIWRGKSISAKINENIPLKALVVGHQEYGDSAIQWRYFAGNVNKKDCSGNFLDGFIQFGSNLNAIAKFDSEGIYTIAVAIVHKKRVVVIEKIMVKIKKEIKLPSVEFKNPNPAKVFKVKINAKEKCEVELVNVDPREDYILAWSKRPFKGHLDDKSVKSLNDSNFEFTNNIKHEFVVRDKAEYTFIVRLYNSTKTKVIDYDLLHIVASDLVENNQLLNVSIKNDKGKFVKGFINKSYYEGISNDKSTFYAIIDEIVKNVIDKTKIDEIVWAIEKGFLSDKKVSALDLSEFYAGKGSFIVKNLEQGKYTIAVRVIKDGRIVGMAQVYFLIKPSIVIPKIKNPSKKSVLTYDEPNKFEVEISGDLRKTDKIDWVLEEK